ncbi:MAG: zf-HC2 domain-containing protein [Candidatus Zixiibacteriota bacterium]
MGTQVDCRAALAKLYEYIDGELGASDREAIATHLDVCRPCLSRFEIERLFHEFVVRRAPRPQARAEFKEQLLRRIEQEGNAPPVAGAPPIDARREAGGFFPLMWRFAVAAAVVLGLGLGSGWLAQHYRGGRSGWFTLGGYHHDLIPVEEDGLETTDFAAAKRFLAEHMDPAVAENLPPYLPPNLIVRASCVVPWQSGHMAHLEFTLVGGQAGHDEELSVFVIPTASLPERMGPDVHTAARSYQTAVLGCCRVVSWHDSATYDCVMVADTEVERLVAIAEAWEATHGQAVGAETPAAAGWSLR